MRAKVDSEQNITSAILRPQLSWSREMRGWPRPIRGQSGAQVTNQRAPASPPRLSRPNPAQLGDTEVVLTLIVSQAINDIGTCACIAPLINSRKNENHICFSRKQKKKYFWWPQVDKNKLWFCIHDLLAFIKEDSENDINGIMGIFFRMFIVISKLLKVCLLNPRNSHPPPLSPYEIWTIMYYFSTDMENW